MNNNAKRSVFFISDRTGITAETLGHSLLTQFDETQFKQMTLPFVNNPEKAATTVEYVNHATKTSGLRAIIFSTTINEEVRAILREADALFMDLFDTYITPIELELDAKSAKAEGLAHGARDNESYKSRIDAMNYALKHDDGESTLEYAHADVILIAPSRCGKTPVCVYMALQHGIFAANYPLTEDDFERDQLPAPLLRHREKLFGLISTGNHLSKVRSERRPGSRYASMQQVSFEIRAAIQLYQRYDIPNLSTHDKSIEEMATLIMQEMNIRRRSF